MFQQEPEAKEAPVEEALRFWELTSPGTLDPSLEESMLRRALFSLEVSISSHIQGFGPKQSA